MSKSWFLTLLYLCVQIYHSDGGIAAEFRKDVTAVKVATRSFPGLVSWSGGKMSVQENFQFKGNIFSTVFVALCDDTFLDIIPGLSTLGLLYGKIIPWEDMANCVAKTICLQAGDMIVWRGDLVHRGCVDMNPNHRIIAHIYTDGMPMGPDNLFPM